MKRFLMVLLLFKFLIFSTGCDRKVNQVTDNKINDDSTQTPLPGDSSGTDSGSDSGSGSGSGSGTTTPSSTIDTSCYADGIGESSNNYITISPIIGKGKNSGVVQWSSKDDPNFQSAGDQEIFLTDSRLNIRVLANPSPGQGETTSTREECRMLPINYQKLQIKVGIKIEGAYGYQSTHIFDDINVNGCSEVHEFTIPQTSSPFTIEILEAKWDYSCTYARDVNDSNSEIYCPFSFVWENDCFSVGLQIATDHTKDIPH